MVWLAHLVSSLASLRGAFVAARLAVPEDGNQHDCRADRPCERDREDMGKSDNVTGDKDKAISTQEDPAN
eukprot:563898-Prorocentrum_minimum.AAC.1